MNDKNELLRKIPAVDEILLWASSMRNASIPHTVLLESVRKEIELLRESILKGGADEVCNEREIAAKAVVRAEKELEFKLRPVINGTGIILHTNLGRAVLGEQVAEHVKQIAMSYSTLEYDVSEKKRGDRHSVVEDLLRRVTGCEAGIVVNNNAAAVMLILSALARDKEVIVSRGELVEIGGSFRIPEIMIQGGAILKEIGTTNKTKFSDYENAIETEKTGLLLKVHTSNFKITGFTEDVSLKKLKELSEAYHIPLAYDLGSGSLIDLNGTDYFSEPSVSPDLADIICFSGDKLLGGPQVGIIIGKKEWIEKIKKSSLMRVFRVDKLVLAALEATLKIYLDEKEAIEKIPMLNMLFAKEYDMRNKAERLADIINSQAEGKYFAKAVKTSAAVGGGSLPGEEMPSWSVHISSGFLTANEIEKSFREHSTPVIGRIYKEKFLLDVRTVREEEIPVIAEAALRLMAAQKE